MDGTAIFLSIISLFIATVYGIDITFIQMLLLVLVKWVKFKRFYVFEFLFNSL